ncbi:MAG: Sir2 silent information regulator family NAD-dependent deacetylase [Clostridiales bacterium]|nr:Sir2 silent information regulator family NAD-dependent deacetylase [Clostridiales bacterium]
MFLRKSTLKYTESCLNEQIFKLKGEIENADAIIIGAGAGLSASAGLFYSGERFEKYFSDFRRKYGITDMYSGGFYPFDSLEKYWAWWSRHIYINRYEPKAGKHYTDLLELVRDKDCFVLTTNVDHQFQKAGFDKKRLFYTQGDYGLWQCSKPCHNKTYENEEAVRQMVNEQKNMKIPSELVPHCPVCGAPMTMNLRCDNTFVEDEGWHKAEERYSDFLRRHKNLHILFLELGVGRNTPVIIKYPFLQMTAENKKAVYACVNKDEAFCPTEIKDRSICIDSDISSILCKLNKKALSA